MKSNGQNTFGFRTTEHHRAPRTKKRLNHNLSTTKLPPTSAPATRAITTSTATPSTAITEPDAAEPDDACSGLAACASRS
eukprot:scaffold58320_cov63-Phaeocystis_antarctica.AAC.1